MGLPPGYVPSPKNPMPRLRRRKYAPTKSPPVVSPFKSLFGSRRQSLAGGPPAPSLLFGAAGGYSAAAAAAAAASGEDASSSGVMTPAEVQLRHCLNARTRRWAPGAATPATGVAVCCWPVLTLLGVQGSVAVSPLRQLVHGCGCLRSTLFWPASLSPNPALSPQPRPESPPCQPPPQQQRQQ